MMVMNNQGRQYELGFWAVFGVNTGVEVWGRKVFHSLRFDSEENKKKVGEKEVWGRKGRWVGSVIGVSGKWRF